MKNLPYLLFLALFLFSNCKKEPVDPCIEKVCVHGDCVDGACECDEYYDGDDCSTLKWPSAAIIKSVQVNSYPLFNPSGNTWDAVDSNADLYLKIYSSSGLLLYTTNVSLNTTYNIPTYFSIPSITLNDVLPLCEIRLYDEDILDDDYMSTVFIQPFNPDRTEPVFQFTFDGIDGANFTVNLDFAF